jgi:RNA polymerase sigma-70 factor, ECF subfamily
MLGDIGDAEDVAQEAFLRLARTDPEQLEDIRAWLTVVTGRLCLDGLRSARARFERPDGSAALEVTAAAESDPADRVTLDDQVAAAVLTVLTRLNPGERVAFVLHDIFRIPFDDIAETVGRPVGTCRQLARRARAKVVGAAPRLNEVSADEQRKVTDAFITACAQGDVQALASVLDSSVWGVGTVLTDPALRQVNHGRHDVATNLLRYLGPGATVVSAAEPVLLAYDRRRLFAVVVLTIRDGLVIKIEATADPSARMG